MQKFQTSRKGFGLRPVEPLPSGQFIMEYVGEVIGLEFRDRVKMYRATDEILDSHARLEHMNLSDMKSLASQLDKS